MSMMMMMIWTYKISLRPVASPGIGHWGTCPPEFDACKILQPFKA